MKILFVFHEAHLTGASLNLFRMIKWLSENSDISMSFLFKEKGVLVNDISKIGDVYYWENPSHSKKSLLKRVLSRIIKQKSYQEKLVKLFELQKFDIIYANTIVASAILKALSGISCKKIWHIHEMGTAINSLGVHHLEADKYVDLIIANSQSTSESLRKLGIDEKKIKIVYPIIDHKEIVNSYYDNNLREIIGISEDAFVIGSSGIGCNGKGINSFVQLPLIVDYFLPGNKFCYLWVGEISDPVIIEHDINKSGINNKVVLPGVQKCPYPYYRLFDIYISCSKEESFGLSAIEAAALGKPLICFEKTGGLEIIVNQANNITVPYMDLIDMAQKIIELYNDRDKVILLGYNASEYSKKFDKCLIMPEFIKILFELSLND